MAKKKATKKKLWFCDQPPGAVAKILDVVARLYFARNMKELGAAQTAKDLGISLTSLLSLEKFQNEPKIGKVIIYADYLDIPLTLLFAKGVEGKQERASLKKYVARFPHIAEACVEEDGSITAGVLWAYMLRCHWRAEMHQQIDKWVGGMNWSLNQIDDETLLALNDSGWWEASK